jgi:FkbM family methyltransferase
MNWIARGGGDPFWAYLPADLGSLQFRCDLSDRLMREVCLTGRYEPQETALLQSALGPGTTFVDVGANWGYFTLVAAHLVGPNGRVLSVEADPRACRALRDNIERNGLAYVSVVELAASDAPGTLHLQEYERSASASGNYGVTRSTTNVRGGRRFEIPARPLDDVLDERGIDRVDLLKMDIEGGEGRALAGLRRTLSARRVGQVLLELHPAHLRDQGTSAEEVMRTLRGHGYRAWKIDHSPAAYRRAAARRMDASSVLAPLADGDDLGSWPHLLWA